ncbi:alkaline phosphatase [Halobacillus mangrovi]|uniref:Alkaline phosphatase n=2 Tax=Halobacillus mangrovi TaxID=402384 RepID=A0A1W5ZXF0_9BACI|nr:alkaline phosphatase [Halobacillus mangrovi]
MLMKNNLKKVLSVTALSTMLFGTATGVTQNQNVSAEENEKGSEVKNVIFLVGDGMGPAYNTAYRYFKDDLDTMEMEETAFDPYLKGVQTVYSADPFHDGGEDDEKENIPDSAATATSMSSGVKTYNGAIAVDLEQQDTKTVLEQAKEQGMSTGLVATSQINHATPAAFGTHDKSRHNYDAIADDYYDDQVNGEHKVDVLLGGGTDYFERDDRNLAEEFQKDGYDYATTTKEMKKSSSDQILGLFAPVGLDKAIDRPKEQPSLEEMTSTALDKLSENEDGFFLMVEGSQIDWAGHDNDVVGAMSEMEDFEKAFQKVIEFAKEDEETLVVATADHSTGGMTIGEGGPYKWDPQTIRAAKKTPDYMAEQIVEEGKKVKTVLNKNIKFKLKEEELKAVQDAVEAEYDKEEDKLTEVDNQIEKIFNERSGTGWTTDGHTGVDVNVYAYGPQSEQFSGLIDNTDQAKNISKILENKKPENVSKVEEESVKKAGGIYPSSMLFGALFVGGGAFFAFRKRKTNQ